MNSKNVPTFTDFVHRFVPAQSQEGTTPTLLLLHGTGGNEEDLLDLGQMLLPGAAFLSPRGKVLENGMPRFFRRLAEGVFDVEDLKQRTHELADFVQSASEVYHFDPTNVIAVGYSNGANIAASMLLLRPDILRGAILLRPMVPFALEKLPDLSKTSVFISAGRFDPIVPTAQTEQLVQVLQQSGATVTTHWLNGGHGLSHEDVRTAKAWLNQLP
ncbi:phospholipase/carboxylesterase [Dictyobacter alpinus]|uniref:Phospholipase/carboxylesterase n=1 Tax=Dictyobacter alpinus TaxID=2014873 RepID=A0A402B5F7_9CHLR|nr:alpha/beta hydrolase [Dictyobacter alpinus]GCE26573.1 phospholipase/carboxylesterase [Dictyobacter alpinus]